MANPIPQMMRAWRYTSARAGLDKSLKLDSNAPSPIANKPLGETEILVKVSAMSVNPADYKLAESPFARFMVGSPASPGMDYSGRVVALGSASTSNFTVGQEVFGRIAPEGPFGTLAEYIVVKNIEGIAAVPPAFGNSMEVAAGIGTCGLTSIQSLQPYTKPGDRVFINGGSGGLGSYAIQVATSLGLQVTTSCSTRKVDFCKSLGAQEVIDYTKQDVSKTLKSLSGDDKGYFKVVMDNVGASPTDLYQAANDYLANDGIYVQLGGQLSFNDARVILVRAIWPGWLGGGKRKWVASLAKPSHDNLVQLGQWVKEGKIKPVTEQVFSFEDAPKAYELLKGGKAKGKIIVRVDG